MNELIFGYETAANEAIKAYNEQMESLKSIKDTAKTIFSSTSLIVAIISSLQAIRTSPPTNMTAYAAAGIFVLICFIALIYLCVRVLLPIKLTTPIKPTWEVFAKTFMDKSEKEVHSVTTCAYLDAIEKNEPEILSSVKNTKLAGWAMISVIAGLIVLIVV